MDAIKVAIRLIIILTSTVGADTLESPYLSLEVDTATGGWAVIDKKSGVRWPTAGTASVGDAEWLGTEWQRAWCGIPDSVRLVSGEAGVVFSLIEDRRAVQLRYEGKAGRPVSIMQDALAMGADEAGYMVVPCREGLLIPADSGKRFERMFGTSDYEGFHMNMLGLVKSGGALAVVWDDAYTFAEISNNQKAADGKLTARFELRGSADAITLLPLGKGDWNRLAEGYRDYAKRHGFAVTLREKIRRDPHVERMLGASNAKLWTCLARRMNEQSTAEESVKVRWTFEEAAQIAEHLHNDLEIERCFFMMGGWSEGGYDCRHPDNLPANPECGGNEALADAVTRIQSLGYVGCLHDNVQDMYRDARSWSPDSIEKRPDGSLITGGRWLGGRAYMVCAPKQVELAKRPQNLPGISRLFGPWSYFIDTTYAVGPRECFDPNHPIDRNLDIAWKTRLSDYAREAFGIFGSECGREWALPHSDFFEGLVSVSGRYYHNLPFEDFGATVIPFFEMVYHDCQICYGKYGYAAEKAAECVAHHVLCARPLYYHSFGDHLYWQSAQGGEGPDAPDEARYARCDNGWAAGRHPWDVFIKNTHEVLGPLHHATAHERLNRLRFLNKEKTVRRASYGSGADAVHVTVNFGVADYEVETVFGGTVVLPRWGFVVEGPRFVAFCSRTWAGERYERPSLFTVRPAGEANLEDASRVRIFHAFGDSTIQWRGQSHNVARQRIVSAQ